MPTMEPSKAERLLLSSIQTPSHLYALQQNYDISSSNFYYFPDEAQFIFEYITEQGNAPSISLISSTFPDFGPTPADDFEYVAKQYSSISKRQQILMAITSSSTMLNDSPNDGAMLLARTLERIVKPDTSHRASLERTTERRWLEYQSRKDQMTTMRIKCGIAPIDEFPIWLQKKQLIGVMGDTKAGKSWLALRAAAEAFQQGHKVLILSPELSGAELSMRSDVVLGRQFGYDLSYKALQQGLSSVEIEYKSYLDSIASDKTDKWVQYDALVSLRPSPSEVETMVAQEKPDVLIIDGVYCMRDDEAYRSSWEDLKGIMVALKGIAVKYDCLIYATNQSNKEGAKLAQTNSDGEPPPYWSVAYGYDFARMVDFLVVMGARSNDDPWRKVVVPLARSGPSFSEAATITFNPDIGDIGATPSDVPADSVDNFEW